MAQTDPVYITFEFRGDIDKEVNKVTLGIKGLRDEAATTYKKLIADSSAAYNAMSAESRKLATKMQENICSLRSLSAMQEQLDRELEAGTISLSGYTQAKAALALQESNLRVVISQGMQQLQQQMATEQEASDSVVALTRKLQQLTEAYSRLSKMDREGSAGKEILEQIQSVDNELQTAQTRLSAYSRTAGTGFNSLQMSIQQVHASCPRSPWGRTCSFSPSRTTYLSWSITSTWLAGSIRQPSRPDSRPRRSGNSCSAGSSAGRRPSSSVSHC